MKPISILMCRAWPQRLEVREISDMNVIQYVIVWASHNIDIDCLQTLVSSQQTSTPLSSRAQPMPGQQPTTSSAPYHSAQPGTLLGHNFPQSSGQSPGFGPNSPTPAEGAHDYAHNQTFSSPTAGPPQLPPAQASTPLYAQPPVPIGMSSLQNNNSNTSLPALRPVFGVTLEELLKRDGSAIPLVVYQCIQAVDLYGLKVEGIYRLSGSSTHVNKLRAIFDNGRF